MTLLMTGIYVNMTLIHLYILLQRTVSFIYITPTQKLSAKIKYAKTGIYLYMKLRITVISIYITFMTSKSKVFSVFT